IVVCGSVRIVVKGGLAGILVGVVGVDHVWTDQYESHEFALPDPIGKLQRQPLYIRAAGVDFLDNETRENLLSRSAFAFEDHRVVALPGYGIHSFEKPARIIGNGNPFVCGIDSAFHDGTDDETATHHERHHQETEEKRFRLYGDHVFTDCHYYCFTHEQLPLVPQRSRAPRRVLQFSQKYRGETDAS